VEERSPGIVSGFEYKEFGAFASLVPVKEDSPRRENVEMSVGVLVSRVSAVLCPDEDFIRHDMHPSKLCVLESILGSDCISYTLVSHVDGFGKLHPGAIHSDDCCGENCVDS